MISFSKKLVPYGDSKMFPEILKEICLCEVKKNFFRGGSVSHQGIVFRRFFPPGRFPPGYRDKHVEILTTLI